MAQNGSRLVNLIRFVLYLLPFWDGPARAEGGSTTPYQPAQFTAIGSCQVALFAGVISLQVALIYPSCLVTRNELHFAGRHSTPFPPSSETASIVGLP